MYQPTIHTTYIQKLSSFNMLLLYLIWNFVHFQKYLFEMRRAIKTFKFLLHLLLKRQDLFKILCILILIVKYGIK